MITLNLLAPEKKIQLRLAAQFRQGARILALFCGFFVVFVGVVVTAKLLLDQRSQALAADIDRLTRQQTDQRDAPLTTAIRDLNTQLGTVAALQTRYTDWIDFLVTFSSAVPKQVRVESIDIRKTTGQVEIHGFAASREDLIAFKQQLEDSGLFLSIVSPIANLIQKTDINFQFDATISSLETTATPPAAAPSAGGRS